MNKILIGGFGAAILSLVFGASFAMAAAPNWTLNPNTTITFTCGGPYVHTLDTVSSQDVNGNLTGAGHYNTDSSYTWNLNGNILGNAITFTIVYTGTATGTTYNSVGTIASDGSISGTTDGNCSGFSMPAGSATLIPVASVITNPATNITASDATLNGTNGPADATGHSFWVSTSTFVTTSPSIPSGVYSTPDMGAIPASTGFSATLSSVTTDGVPGNLPTIMPNTTYYFVAWSLVGGTWYPGAELNFTTESGPAPATPSVTTNSATGITPSDATLNGTNGPVAADQESFWVSTNPTIDTSSPNIPAGVYSTPVLPGVAAGAAFSDPLSLVTTNGIITGGAPGNMLAITAGTQYYYVAWSHVNGTWYPGAVLSVIIPVSAVSCPAGTTQSVSPVDTIQVNSSSSTPAVGVTPLASGQQYMLVSSGKWQNSNLNAADSMYSSLDNWATYQEGYDTAPYFLGPNEFNLEVDGKFVNWGPYDGSSHTYNYLYTGTEAPVSLGVFDGDSNQGPVAGINSGWYGDNSGSLSVNVYACTPNTGSLTIVKDAIGGNGKFNFTSNIPNANGGTNFSIITVKGTGTGNSQTFSNLTPGTYNVTETASNGWTMTDSECSAVVVAAGDPTICTITNTNNRLLGEIRGTKYEDRDGDGTLKDGDHHRLAGVTIDISGSNSYSASTVTDKFGNYRFVGLQAGTYTVSEVVQPGWVETYPHSGSYTINLSAGQVSKRDDFGNFKLGTISGMKYDDVNGNGRKDSGDVGLQGWIIKLKGPGSFSSTTVTDANGNYFFGSLGAGTYTLSEVAQSDWTQTQHPDTIKIWSGTNAKNENFGNTQKVIHDKDHFPFPFSPFH